MHREPIPLNEKPVRINPLVSGLLAVAVLLRLELPEHIHYYRREFQRTLRLFSLGSVRVNSFLLAGVIRGTLYADDAVFPVNILPFQSKHFSAPESAVHSENNEGLLLQGLVFECRKDFLDFFDRVYLFSFFSPFGTRTRRQGLSHNISMRTA